MIATQLWHHTFIDASLADVNRAPCTARGPACMSFTARHPLARTPALPARRPGRGVQRRADRAAVRAAAGLVSVTSLPIDSTRADLWVGAPDVLSVDLGGAIPSSFGQPAGRAPGGRRRRGVSARASPTGRSPTAATELCIVIGSSLEDDALGSSTG